MTGPPVFLAIAFVFLTPVSRRPADSCIIIQAVEQSKAAVVNLEIVVADVAGDRVPGALIQLRSRWDTKLVEYRSNDKGLVTASVSPGDYTILVRSRGFKDWTRDSEFESGGSYHLNVQLMLENEGGILVQSFELPFLIEHSLPNHPLDSLPLKLTSLLARKFKPTQMHRSLF